MYQENKNKCLICFLLFVLLILIIYSSLSTTNLSQATSSSFTY